MNKSEEYIIKRLTAFGDKPMCINTGQKRLVQAMECLAEKKIINVSEEGHNWDFVYQVMLNLPAYQCEDCAAKYNNQN